MSNTRERALVAKFGGSTATSLEGVNLAYFAPLLASVRELLLAQYARVAFVIGGGPRARALQATVEGDPAKHAIGIRATQEHAAMLSQVAQTMRLPVYDGVPTNPTASREMIADKSKRMFSVGGLQIGQSTDAVATTLAEQLYDEGYEPLIMILSNIARIYTADPKQDLEARPIRRGHISRLVQEGVLLNDPALFTPGMNVTIDPVAVHRLESHPSYIPLWFGHGEDTTNITRVLSQEEPDDGTTLVESDQETEYYTR